MMGDWGSRRMAYESDVGERRISRFARLRRGSRTYSPFMVTQELNSPKRQQGKIGYILAWLLGIPIPILIVIFLLRGCN